MPGQQDLWPWLQSIMANQGAANPNDPNAIPAAAPQAMPGSGLNGMPAMTQGGPSMGFPAQTSPFGAQPPTSAGDDSGVNNPYQAAANSFFPGAAPGQGGIGSDARFASPSAPAYQGGGIGSDWRYPTAVAPGQGGIGSDARFPLSTAPAGSPSATPKTVKGPLASAAGGGGPAMKRTPGAANLGYYQGNNRFIGIDQPNASPQNSMRAGPQATALNLAGLFGGRGQPQAAPANPANVPAANAQPVSASAPNAYPGDAGWGVDAQGNPIPDYGIDPTQMNPAALASAVSKPNWWQQFGRPDMNPGQLASAVRKPNWFRNV